MTIIYVDFFLLANMFIWLFYGKKLMNENDIESLKLKKHIAILLCCCCCCLFGKSGLNTKEGRIEKPATSHSQKERFNNECDERWNYRNRQESAPLFNCFEVSC